MTDTTHTGDRPKAGINRPTVLFVVWVGVGLLITGLGILNIVQEGFEEAWVLFMAGLALLWFMLRDWFLHDGGDFVTRSDDLTFLGMTVLVLAVMLWVLLAMFVL